MQTFRELLTERLADLTLAEIAELLGVSESYASQVRSGRRGKGRTGLSNRVLGRVFHHWPELAIAYVRDLRAHESAKADAGTPPQAMSA